VRAVASSGDISNIAKGYPGSSFIYGLIDPRTDEVRYIGKSIRPLERLRNHINEPKTNCHRSHWIQGLKKEGLEPEIIIFESVWGEWPWQEAERFWINYGKRNGWPLTNNTDGGDGVDGLQPETRERMRRTWLGRRHSEKTKAIIGLKSSQRRHSDETKGKMSAAQKGRKILWGDEISEAVRKITHEQCEEIKTRLGNGELGISLAKEFGVHRTTISKIKMGTYFLRHRRHKEERGNGE